MNKFTVGQKVRVLPGQGFSDCGEKNIVDGEIHTIATVVWDGQLPGYHLEGKGDWLYGEFRFEADQTKVNFQKETNMENKTEVNFHVLRESIVLNYDGKTHVIAKGDDRYEGVLTCIRDNRLSDIPAIVEIERGFNGSGLELKDGLVYAEGTPIPTELNNRILAYKEAKIPYDSLLKFWENLKKNPSFNSRKMLFDFITHNGHPLTQDGCFIAYRGVREDFKDVHTGKFDNKPGSVCEMPRSEVDENPNNTCSSGLHIACYEYAKGFGVKLVEVKVNPADVVAVPTDYNGTKMRVCRFEVVQECANIREELVYPEDTSEEDELEEELDSEFEEKSDFDINDHGADYAGSEPPESAETPCKCDQCSSSLAETQPMKKTTKISGSGSSRQKRHAVRNDKGKFVKA